ETWIEYGAGGVGMQNEGVGDAIAIEIFEQNGAGSLGKRDVQSRGAKSQSAAKQQRKACFAAVGDQQIDMSIAIGVASSQSTWLGSNAKVERLGKAHRLFECRHKYD